MFELPEFVLKECFASLVVVVVELVVLLVFELVVLSFEHLYYFNSFLNVYKYHISKKADGSNIKNVWEY